MNGRKRVLLAGNANVGKSTVFNEITGSRQHTGNWTGKTVDIAAGHYYYKFNDYEIIDLPGTCSLLSVSEEERIAKRYLCFEDYDCVICVVDATCVERNLKLVLQILEVTSRVVVLLNLCDEAKKQNISVDEKALSDMLGVPVVRATARSGKGINRLLEQVHMLCTCSGESRGYTVDYGAAVEPARKLVKAAISGAVDADKRAEFYALRILEDDAETAEYIGKRCADTAAFEEAVACAKRILESVNMDGEAYQSIVVSRLHTAAHEIAVNAVEELPSDEKRRHALLDRILLGKFTSIPVMLAIICLVLWLTIVGSNYPSALLRSAFDSFELRTAEALLHLGVNETFVNIFVCGMLNVLLWVVAVMLPPMAIFFPLFSLLEDFGFLPRLAFNLDGAFERCGACGKQALTTCMGYGCNAVGVTGCRIIDSPRERLVAVVTNSLTPCNGRFPLLIAVISMFFTQNSVEAALILMGLLCLSMLMTFASSSVLSSTVLKGEPSSFTLELPAFRRPKFFRVIGETVKERVLPVLLRAAVVAAPAGVVIWALSNISVGGETLLASISQALDPVGRALGLDGVLLLAFILSFPANEIVIPIALTAYLSKNVMSDYSSLSDLRDILLANGWTAKTALCTCIFSMFHFPCSTTLITIFKETKSLKWTLLSVLTPLASGVLLCLAVNLLF